MKDVRVKVDARPRARERSGEHEREAEDGAGVRACVVSEMYLGASSVLSESKEVP
jgi:hypothetical protein